jgi:hypothetical protein
MWLLKEGRYWVWSSEGGNELTYRQVYQVTDTPDEVKTCPTHYNILLQPLGHQFLQSLLRWLLMGRGELDFVFVPTLH